MTIKARLYYGFGAALLAVAIVGAMGFGTIKKEMELFNRVLKYDNKAVSIAKELKVTTLNHRNFEKEYFLNIGNIIQQQKVIGQFDSASVRLRNGLGELKTIAGSNKWYLASVSPYIDSASNYYESYYKGFKQVLEQIKNDYSMDAYMANAMMSPYSSGIEGFQSSIDSLVVRCDTIFSTIASDLIKIGKRSCYIILFLFVIAVGAILTVGILVTKRITSGIRILADQLKDIACGERDLTKRINIKSKDEIGELAGWFNTFAENLHSIIVKLASISKEQLNASEDLAVTSVKIASNAEEMSTQSKVVTETSEKTATKFGNLTKSTDDMDLSVSMIAAAIEEMSCSISEITKNCHKESEIATDANARAHNAGSTIESLEDSADEIGKIVNVISNIADKTNLLALNAAIEAASAGDAGKGFAIVANEVKQLAKQTSVATSEIRQRVSGIQASMCKSVESIESVRTVIDDLNTVSHNIVNSLEQQTITVNEIASNTSGVKVAAHEIASTVNSTAGGLQEMSCNIHGVDNAASDTTKSIVFLKNRIERLRDNALGLENVVMLFKI